jgi:hypothetical protein
LWPKLTEESVETHKKLGIQATEYLESIFRRGIERIFQKSSPGSVRETFMLSVENKK